MAKRHLQLLGDRNETVWNHLNDILNYVLREKPEGCMQHFEDMSRQLRTKKFFMETPPFEEIRDKSEYFDDAIKYLKYHRKVECLYELDDPYEDISSADTDFIHSYQLLHEAGVGIPKSELYKIYLGMRVLAKRVAIAKLRFWGKIFGTVRNYFIIEAQLKQEEIDQRKAALTEMNLAAAEDTEIGEDYMRRSAFEPIETDLEKPVQTRFESPLETDKEEMIGDEPETRRKLSLYKLPILPLPPPINVVEIPSELPGEGVNKFVYYAANDPSDVWFELPDVTPKQIQVAKTIHKYLTGKLENNVNSFPTFPGNECDLLRAQIARISACTLVSPLGYYTNGGEEEMIELEEGALFMENPEYEPLPIKDLMNTSHIYWVHHEQFILNQGRTTFWDPPRENAEEMDYEGEEGTSVEREIPPEILRSLDEDVSQDAGPAWTTRLNQQIMGDDSSVMIRSNIWPGAVTVTKGRKLMNFYIGWGVKCYLTGFQPYKLGEIQHEYELGPEIMEMDDPTVEQEELRWQMLHPRSVQNEEEMEGEQENHSSENES